MERYFTFKFYMEIIPIILIVAIIIIGIIVVVIASIKEEMEDKRKKEIQILSDEFDIEYQNRNMNKYEFFGTYKGHYRSLISYDSTEKYTIAAVELGDNQKIYGYFKTKQPALQKGKSKIGCFMDKRTAQDGKTYYVFEQLS